MLLFAQAEQIGGAGDLGFDLLLAVPVVAVGDQRDHDAAGVAARDLEGGAVVVEFVLRVPAHAVALLGVCRLERWGRPRSILRSPTRCGARMTQPVWPDHPAVSSLASFSGRNGSPALAKMLSTKSRFETRAPGAKNRTSIVCLRTAPGTPGQTTGRSNTETKVRARSDSGSRAVYGSVSRSSGGVSAALSRWAKVLFGTHFLSAGTGNPPSTM